MGYKTKSMIYAESNLKQGFKTPFDISLSNNFSKSPDEFNVKKPEAKKEKGSYRTGAVLLNETGKEVGQDAGVLSGLASGSAGTRLGTAIGIMVNKMDKSPRSTAKFDSKIKKAQGRGNLAKAARLEKREAGYAYRQEKRATRIDPTYKGKTDNTKAKKLEAGKIRRGGEFYKKKVFNEVKPISTQLRKPQAPTTSMNQITFQNEMEKINFNSLENKSILTPKDETKRLDIDVVTPIKTKPVSPFVNPTKNIGIVPRKEKTNKELKKHFKKEGKKKINKKIDENGVTSISQAQALRKAKNKYGSKTKFKVVKGINGYTYTPIK